MNPKYISIHTRNITLHTFKPTISALVVFATKSKEKLKPAELISTMHAKAMVHQRQNEQKKNWKIMPVIGEEVFSKVVEIPIEEVPGAEEKEKVGQ